MKEIEATLPVLGAFRVHLHREAAMVLDFFGPAELERLGRVPHLGVAASVYPGINHTRLEYVLLQCAVTQLVAKQYKDDARMAVSAKVQISGRKVTLSSGEELLKSWAILGNVGHPKWTYGTERGLFEAARSDPSMRSWLLSGCSGPDLRRWAEGVFTRFHDAHFKTILSLLRIRVQTPRDPRKGLLRALIRNRYLPLSQLSDLTASGREKLARLRMLCDNIRLISMVLLDAHYSHSPLRLHLLPAIQQLAESSATTNGAESFMRLLRSTAGWLAEEVYLHPRAVAAIRAYEVRAEKDALKRFRSIGTDAGRRSRMLGEIMQDGFGQPRTGGISPLVRLSFQAPSRTLLGPEDRARTSRVLSDTIAEKGTLISIEHNGFKDETYLDVLYRRRAADIGPVGRTYARLATWLLRQMEVGAAEHVRRLVPAAHRVDLGDSLRLRLFRRRIEESEGLLLELMLSVGRYLIPEGWSLNPDGDVSYGGSLVGWSIVDSSGHCHSNVEDVVGNAIQEATAAGADDRRGELLALQRCLPRRRPTLLVTCPLPFVIRDQHRKPKDEWDGMLVEMSDQRVRTTIIEAKMGHAQGRRETLAMKQLSDTRRLIKAHRRVQTRRTRLSGLGARLDVYLWNEG